MMIEINLLPGVKKAAKGGAAQLNVGATLAGFKDKVKPLILKENAKRLLGFA